MKILTFLLCVCFFLFRCGEAKAQPLRIMSYNIRYANKNDEVNSWDNRKQKVIALISKYHPDILGTQEVLQQQFIYMKRQLNHYRAVGVGRDDGRRRGEYAAIFYNKDSFALQNNGTFWLSETPDKPGSKGWDAAITRIATWCSLKQRSTGQILFVFNTHFDHIGQAARKNSALLLKQKIKEIAADNTVILLGDLNMTPNEEPYKILNSDDGGTILTDIARQNNEATFCGFEVANKNCKRIDYIFCEGNIQPVSYNVPDDHDGLYYPSDHKPVFGTVLLLHKP